MDEKTYTVQIKELLHRDIEVKAKNENAALNKVKAMYRKEDVVLGADDYDHTIICCNGLEVTLP